VNEAEQLIIALGLPAEGKMLVKFLKAENKWLRENLDVKNAILAKRDLREGLTQEPTPAAHDCIEKQPNAGVTLCRDERQ
jgi:hypothetical protein